MFECTICGLLSLGGNACPACGSQIRVDLTEQDDDGSPLPTEVPGLDEAVASWNDLEGIETAVSAEEVPPKAESKGTLPFGFSGTSNTNMSRLPFGIGSYATGMPFDGSEDDAPLPLVSAQITERREPIASVPEPVADALLPHVPPRAVEPIPATPVPAPTVAPTPAPVEPAALPPVPLPPPVVTAPLPSPVAALPEAPALAAVPLPRIEAAPIVESTLPRLEAITTPPPAVMRVEANPVVATDEPSSDPDVPAMWRIDAAAPNMEQIYAQSDQVVEVVHTMDAEPTIYAHEPAEAAQRSTSDVISLDIHPAQALAVRLEGLPELEPTLSQGFEALGNESWAQAAIAFQKLAARMPGDAAVFNNYGLSLLQRALTMAKSPDLELQTLASTQFESSILALREAAKSAPTEGTILLNLAHALLVSGRAEKAIGLVQMHDQTQPQTTVSGNLQAAALVSMGESSAAKSLLQRLHQDDVVQANLDRLSY
ncbi:MAG: hypothetical protein P8Q98_05130 [Candidatus Poseidoniaceae archaeon]|nr:hypothetical protein [Candidatus Poseidoniaceae archaeon]